MNAIGGARTNLQVTWDDVAAAYDHWYDQFECDAQPINDWICRSVRLAPGMHVLDLGSGSGQPAFTLAQFVSPKGSVIATDLSPAMVDALLRRASSTGIANLRAQVMDMEKLDFPGESFDAVTCRWGFMWPPDHLRAIAEAHRVLRSQGWLATATWDVRENNPLQGPAVIERILGPASVAGSAPRVRFDDPGALREMFAQAGFRNVAVEAVPLRTEYESFEQWWQYSTDSWTTVRKRIQGLANDELSRLKEAARAEVAKFGVNGKLIGPGSCLCLAAQK
jgi:ubiquinone/menaquinone biosynthesis C-methylase UbiE